MGVLIHLATLRQAFLRAPCTEDAASDASLPTSHMRPAEAAS